MPGEMERENVGNGSKMNHTVCTIQCMHGGVVECAQDL